MAFTDPIVLADYAAANKSFNRGGFIPQGCQYIESTATPSDKRLLTIKHTTSGLGPNKSPISRHLVQISHEKWNATLGKTEKLVMNLTITLENSSSFSANPNQYDILTFLKNWISTANYDKLIRGES
jgi:hypothetical protein